MNKENDTNEVFYCEECIYCLGAIFDEFSEYLYCSYWNLLVNDDDFCSEGEIDHG